VAKDIVIVGSSMREGGTPKTHDNTKGLVRAFDVRTGKLLWTFHTIPGPNEFGNETWENGSWADNGNTGVWTQISVDEDLGLVYLPVESPTGDYYGGHRPGANLFGETLVCVDLKTGQRKWYFQFVHHPIWNMDISSAPILADITVGGRQIKAVAQPTKQAWLYVFDRVTGNPVWPIEEVPVPQSDTPGEKTSPTQPFPTKPPAYDRHGVTIDDLVDFTPDLRAQAVKLVSRYKLGPFFTPPVVSKVGGPLGALQLPSALGGTNWTGGAYDPETHTVYVPSQTSVRALGLIPSPSKEFSDMDYIEGTAGEPVKPFFGPGEFAGADAPPLPAVPGNGLEGVQSGKAGGSAVPLSGRARV
jgi:quinoprotein glucose dehydrogenase